MILYLAGYKPCARRWCMDTSDIYLLSSFWEHKSGRYGSYVLQEKHILDSGAFSAFSGKNNGFDWDSYVRKYADFILKNNIQKFFELDIDVVVGLRKVEYYRRYLEDKTGRKLFPCGMLQEKGIIFYVCVKNILMWLSVRLPQWKKVEESDRIL
mgnify:CR=1 FL=1|jgi:hypothetical protein